MVFGCLLCETNTNVRILFSSLLPMNLATNCLLFFGGIIEKTQANKVFFLLLLPHPSREYNAIV